MTFRMFEGSYTVWLSIMHFYSGPGSDYGWGLGDGGQEVSYGDADVDFDCAQKFEEPIAEVERDVVASGVRGCQIG